MTDSIILDVDGTLWDSTEIVARAWMEVLAKNTSLNLTITPDLLKSVFGRTLPDIAGIIFSEETRERQLELIDMCCKYEHELLRKYGAPLYPAWPQVLKILSARYPLFLVSNCEAGYIETFLECTGFGCYIKDHLCPGDTGNAKADNIREIIHRHDLKSPVYVGDTAGDYKAVKEAGPQIPFVFASYGFGKVENPDYIIQSPLDLTHLF
ncbi:HAD family hydrolase [Lawsonibacter sp. OA9]|uniref:HAD family hydrolase n=1 Tax=Oscillospiraceae TaxID=216572 RepID=UPI001F065A61|nr:MULTISPECIES: HAD family hydrolase [Oscillospiraceae]MCH1978219.1 HAD family hydrolase [Lawsonibacter sp. OA9]MCH1982647.1 HAD family hydrolase [Ruminococcus sp. OA3]